MPVYSRTLELAWQIAANEAGQAQSEYIEPAHFFVAVCTIADFTDASFLQRYGFTGQAIIQIRAEVAELVQLYEDHNLGSEEAVLAVRERYARRSEAVLERPDNVIHRSEKSRVVFARAEAFAEQEHATHVMAYHLLAALLDQSAGGLHSILQAQHVDVDDLLAALINRTETTPRGREVSLGPILTEYGTDLVAAARNGELQEAIGRNAEMLQIVRTLSRETKNNPLLVGDPGVGKTAVVEGLAWRIAQGRVPDVIRNTHIIQIDVADLVTNTGHRGEFEGRLRALIKEVADQDDIVLLIDEIHTLVGAGRMGGSLDAANIMKPALARGELRCIGATTRAEYRRHIESDPALERRFQPIRIEEPSPEDAKTMLAGLQERLEQRHRVTIAPEAIEEAVNLSVRYLPDRRLPDKAIDLLDEACARAQITRLSVGPGKPATKIEMVTALTIATVLSEWTSIPLGQFQQNERSRIAEAQAFLQERVIGQDNAVAAVASTLQRSYAGLKHKDRPVGVLLFVGPTGVGKTELVKATAEFLFGARNAMIRIDMSEYMERHSVSRLIGAPPGYVGHDNEGQLSRALRDKPFSVVLLDEIEKAHPDVMNLFLQVFDDGRLTDSKGRVIDASNALFVMTSNLSFSHPGNLGFYQNPGEARAAAVPGELKDALRPELLNRIDEVVAFQNLRPEHSRAIVKRLVAGLVARLRDQDITLEISDLAVALLSTNGFDEEYGARELRRTIERLVENPLGGMLLRGEIPIGSTIRVDAHRDRIVFRTDNDDDLPSLSSSR